MTQSELKRVASICAELGAAKAENDRLRGLVRRYVDLFADVRLAGQAKLLDAEARAALSQKAEPVCDTCHGQGEVWTGENQSFGYMSMQPPEPIMEACPECGGEAEPAEPAPAQDERGDFFQWWNSELRAELRRSCAESWAYCIWKASDANTRYNVAFHLSEIEQTEQQPVGLARYRDLAEFALRQACYHNLTQEREALAKEFLALIDAARPAQTEQQPSGWKLVPVELTQEMNDAGRTLLAQGSAPMSKVFRAILDAAPVAQTTKGDDQ